MTVGIHLRVYFEFQDIWVLTHKREKPDQKTLAELRWRWARSQPIAVDHASTGRAAVAIQSLLECGDRYLRSVARSSRHLRRRTRRRLLQRARQVKAWRRDLASQMANAPAIAHRIALTAERVLAECEAAAPLILRMRWYLTAHWKRLCADVLNGRRRIRHFRMRSAAINKTPT